MSSSRPRTAAFRAEAHSPPLRETLAQGALWLGLALSTSQIDALLAYLDLIAKWNRVYNLTAVREPQDMLIQHVLDSLAVVRPLRRQAAHARRVLDVGSGAGLPGVVLAIACPDLDLVCLDTVSKKAAFIGQVAGALGLGNLHGQHARVESLNPPVGQRWDLVCSRAFASLGAFVGASQRSLAPDGIWMAMKGKVPQDEIDALPADIDMFHVEQLQVPQLDAHRCIVWMRRR
jgi:16S rRNA (guanine527-N7)-methyltransferase